MDSTAVSVSAPLESLPPTLAQVIPRVLQQLGYTEGNYRPADHIWATAPHFGWPRGSEREKWHGRQDPGYLVIITVGAVDGGSLRLAVAARAVCHFTEPDTAHPPDQVERMVAILASMQALSEVERALPHGL